MKHPRMDRFDVNRDVPLPVRDESKAEPEPVMDEPEPQDILPMRKEDLGDKQ